MEINNEYLPVSKQDIDNLEETQEYVDYLGECVKEGYMDEELAQELIEGGKWDVVREMMEREPDDFEDFKNYELYGNESVENSEEVI